MISIQSSMFQDKKAIKTSHPISTVGDGPLLLPCRVSKKIKIKQVCPLIMSTYVKIGLIKLGVNNVLGQLWWAAQFAAGR